MERLIAWKFGIVLGLIGAWLSGCGSAGPARAVGQGLPPIDTAQADGGVVHGRAIYAVTSGHESALARWFSAFGIARAHAGTATATTSVSYTNSASTTFRIDISRFFAQGLMDGTLNLGSVGIAELSDNQLRVCGVGGKVKCTRAVIRVYTVGTTAGFVHTEDGYGVPVYTSGLNPRSAIGVGSSAAVEVESVSVDGVKNVLARSDLSNTTFAVTADFSNAGAGSYTMNYVVEYVLY